MGQQVVNRNAQIGDGYAQKGKIAMEITTPHRELLDRSSYPLWE